MTASRNLPTEAINYSQPGTVAAPGDVVGLTIGQAAAALDLPESTLRFWIDRRGCPVHRRGGRGRGHSTLIDVAAVRRWMDGRNQPATTTAATEHDLALMFAQRLPDVLADALYRAWCGIDSPAKRQLAASVAVAWYQAINGELDRLRQQHPDIPHVTSLPDTIVKLKSIV